MPETDVTKMKVADLKRELKLRGLSTTGNKNELQDRLQTALIEGDISLDDTAIADVLEEDVGGLTDDEDKLLVDENELLKSPISTPTEDQFLCSPGIGAEKGNAVNNAPAPAKKIILRRENSQIAIKSAQEGDSADVTPTAKENATPTPSEDNLSANATTRKHIIAGSGTENNGNKKITQLTAQERLELRAKRFGVQPSNTTSQTKTEKSPSKTSGASILANNGDKETDEKQMEALKRRAERFGCVISSKLAKQDVSERLLKRKERFGLAEDSAKASPESVVKATTTDPTKKPETSDVWAEKARARLERFKATATADK